MVHNWKEEEEEETENAAKEPPRELLFKHTQTISIAVNPLKCSPDTTRAVLGPCPCPPAEEEELPIASVASVPNELEETGDRWGFNWEEMQIIMN